MIYFTKYAEQKFEILNKHKVFITREQVEDAIVNPDKVEGRKNCIKAAKEGIKVIYKKEQNVLKVLTFFPITG